jgi:(S)-ureidoglycine aminohydrolase
MEALLFQKRGSFKIKSRELEQLVIVKKGEVGFSIPKSNRIMGPGSIALLMPGDKLNLLVNPGDQIYVMKYKAREGQSLSRGKKNGGSFLKDWEEQTFKTHDKGGIRNFYNQPTAACQRMEMHVSNLNPGIKSHEPHTHRAAEIVLMIKGKSEMELDGKIVHGDAGDIYFLGSEVPHAIKNIDDEPIQYFAYQFE